MIYIMISDNHPTKIKPLQVHIRREPVIVNHKSQDMLTIIKVMPNIVPVVFTIQWLGESC